MRPTSYGAVVKAAQRQEIVNRLRDTAYRFPNVETWRVNRDRVGYEPGQAGWFGPGGPPGGPDRVGYRDSGPMGTTLGAQRPIDWNTSGSMNQGPLQWSGIEPRRNTQPVGPGMQIAQADVLRARQ